MQKLLEVGIYNVLMLLPRVKLESTSALTFNFFLFFIFISACIFNSRFPLLFQQFRIMYLFWESIWEISYTMSIRDCCQNPAFSSCLYHLILPRVVIFSLTVFLCNPWQCVLFSCILNISWFCFLSSLISILLPYAHICCN